VNCVRPSGDDKFGLDPHNQAIGAVTLSTKPRAPRPDKADDVDWVGISEYAGKTRPFGIWAAATALKARGEYRSVAAVPLGIGGERAGRCGGPNRPLAFTSLGVNAG